MKLNLCFDPLDKLSVKAKNSDVYKITGTTQESQL